MVKKELETALKFNGERIYSNIDKDIFLISRRNCDGLVAGTIISTALLKLDTRFTFRTIDNLDPDTIARIISEDHDFNIFIDLNIEDYGKIKNLNDKFLIIDHNKILQNVKEYEEYLLNPGNNTHKNGKFRTFAEISEEEKNIILDAITKFIFLSSKNNRNKGIIENISNDLVNQLFEFVKEDSNSVLHDGREFAFVINACIRNLKSELAIGICMGERNDTLIETEQLTNDYKANIINLLEKIFKEKWRLIDNGLFVFINGEGILADDNVKEMVQILSESITLRKKWFFLRTLSNDNNYRFYSIKGNNCDLKFDINSILKQYPDITSQVDRNISNIHTLKVSYSKIEEVTSIIRKEISKYERESS